MRQSILNFVRLRKSLPVSMLTGQARRNELIDQYRQLHAETTYGRGYLFGRGSARLLGHIQLEVQRLAPITTILDYGCARSPLVDWLAKLNDATALRYDPAIPEYATLPTGPVDLVINTDVLEHIPEELLDGVLGEISSLSQNAYFHIATARANTTLPNGENAHCTVRKEAWWRKKLEGHFRTVRATQTDYQRRCAFVTWRGE